MSRSGSKKQPPAPWAILRGHAAGVNALDLHLSELLVSGDADGVVNLWSLKTKRVVKSNTQAHSKEAGGVIQVAFLEDGRRVLTQGRIEHASIKCWDVERFDTPLCSLGMASLGFCKFSALERREESDAAQLVAAYGEVAPVFSEEVMLWSLLDQKVVQKFALPSSCGLERTGTTGQSPISYSAAFE